MKRDLVALFVCCLVIYGCSRRAPEPEPPAPAADTRRVVRKDGPTHDDIAGKADLKAKAEDLKHTIVTPHLETWIEAGKNVLWCNTFQLAWNELRVLTGGPISMESPPPMVPALNNKAATKYYLDVASYVAIAGLASEGVYSKIEREMREKFKGQASPDLFRSTPKEGWVMYAYLFKELPFEWAFTRCHKNLTFEGYWVDSFGIGQYLESEKNEARMAEQVAVLDHRNNNDFIIELKTRAKDDRLILAKVPPKSSLRDTIWMLEERVAQAKPTAMREMESLWIPVLNFDILRTYSELYGHPIVPRDRRMQDTEIALAVQSIRFRLDETGAVLKSESEAIAAKAPRRLVFDKPFLILLRRRAAGDPYFALWVGNAELLVPRSKRAVRR